MILIDRLLISGVRFVLDKLAAAVDSELNDTSRLHEALLDAQMRLELGQISEAEFAELESVLTARLRELRARELEQATAAGMQISGVEVTVDDALDEP